MKQNYWYLFGNAILADAVIALGSYVDYYLLPSWERLPSLILVFLCTGVSFYICSHKSPISLTEEELQTPVPERQDFSLLKIKPNWIYIVLMIFMSLIALYSFLFLYLGLYKIFAGAAFIPTVIKLFNSSITVFKEPAFIAFLVFWAVLIIFQYRRKKTSKYIIDGNMLIVQEVMLTKTEEEIHIPLDTIDDVYLRYKNTAYCALYLNIQGIERRLNAGLNSVPLGKAILQHKHALS